MCVLGDLDIKSAIASKSLVVEPLERWQIRENGLDLTLGCEVARFRKDVDEPLNLYGDGIDRYYEKINICERGELIVRPHERLLLHTHEYVKLPSSIVALVNLKSTLARAGLYIPPTVVDAGFEGQIVIELIGSDVPVKLKPGMPFIHLILLRTCSAVEFPYSVQGSYQGQTGVRLPNRLRYSKSVLK